jgi:malate synthase
MTISKVGQAISLPEKYWSSEYKELFPDELIKILSSLHEKFNPSRLKLLQQRIERQKKYDQGELPQFLDRDSEAVTGNWKVATIPPELLCRRVEITGPVNSAKMVINMLNRSAEGHRADMAMLDFEDSLKPSFKNILDGYKNVIGAVSGNLTAYSGEKKYQLNQKDKAYVMVRARGLHLGESNIKIKGEAISGGLLDLAVCFFHTAKIYLSQNLTPKYYIPKCEDHLEARWWNDVFNELEKLLGFNKPTLKATFLIETLPATFQVEEILYEIREHAAGLNVGRWDKIFSDIKVLKNHPDRILADRSSINMECSWMENYAKRVIKICHDRGAFAMGGMAAFTPGKTKELRAEQMKKVAVDKKREASWGHDGCWVSHPYFIGVAMEAMNFTNQRDRKCDFDKYGDIMPKNTGPHSLQGLRTNIRVGIAFMHGWNKDIGCVAFDNLMEDLATLEISRAQTWQWLHHKITLDEGIVMSKELVTDIFQKEYLQILHEMKEDTGEDFHQSLENDLTQAKEDALKIFTNESLDEFLTLVSESV